MAIWLIVSSCSSKSIPVSSGCLSFCEQIPEPKGKMFRENMNSETYNFLVEVHNLKHCGCLTEQNEIIACQKKYEVEQ